MFASVSYTRDVQNVQASRLLADGTRIPLPTVFDAAAQVATFEIDRFSVFVVGEGEAVEEPENDDLYAELPPVVPPVPVGRPPIMPFTLQWGMGVFMTPTAAVQNPVRTYSFPGHDGAESTLVAMRVLESVLGIPHGNMTWDGATQTATITAPNRAGTPVELRVTVDSPTAFINGQSVSIAQAGDFPAGVTVYPLHLDGSVFLPLRFIFQVFEIDFAWDGATRTVTILG